MGSCQSISHESNHTQSNSTAITVKEKPAEEETKECQPTTIASNENHNDKQNDKEIATTTQTDVTANHVNQTNGTQSSDPDQHTQSSEQQSTPAPAHVEPIPTETLATSSTTDNEVKPEQTATNTTPPQPTNDAASEAFDEEFKSTVKTVLLLLLDRLVRTMEYESFMFQELALATGLPNYMELFDYREFEKFLRDNFAIPSSPAPMQNDADVKHVSQYFSLFLSLAQNGTSSSSTRSFPSRVTFTQRLQTLCSSTSSKLLAWCESPHASSEVKEHFLFFSKALEFARGDLINQPKLLYQNIDEITA